jgi:2-polyprenyl-6-methoxyphenol hydroxylase-like FAD-dependent oxidoreductase
LIAGGGPVGLALAIQLGMAGIRCTVLEQRDGSVTVPKMSGLSIRGMEINRRLGVAEKAKTHGWPENYPNDFVYCTNLVGYELTRERLLSDATAQTRYSPERKTGCAQIFYDPMLLDRARSLAPVTVRHFASLDSFMQDAECVHATVTDRKTGRSETIEARYLVGCDGADGTVVTALGFGYEGVGHVANSVNVYFRSAALMTIHDKGWARFFRFTDAGGTWGELIGIDGRELWRLSVLEGEPGLDGHAYIRRLAGTDVPYELLSVTSWERRERVADRYRDGRVFICGDAAHQLSPTGGLGLHTGLADSLDLAWKLTATLNGWGGEALLDSYEIERKPVAFDNVRVSTEAFELFATLPSGPAIADDTDEGERERRAFADAVENTHNCRGPLNTENLRTGYCYEPSPICIPDGTQRPPIESRRFIPVARPGTRAPHAWISAGRSTLDLFGDAFVLLRFGDAPPSATALIDAAQQRGVPLQVVDLADPQIAALYERRLVLVRPDGHVAWRGDAVGPDALSIIDCIRGAAALSESVAYGSAR